MSDKVKLKVGNLLISNGMLTYAEEKYKNPHPTGYITKIYKNNDFKYVVLVWLHESETTDIWVDKVLLQHIKNKTLFIYE